MSADAEIVHERKFQIPFFMYKEKKLAYLWLNGKKLMLGFCLDKSLQDTASGEKAKDQYESMRIDPNADLPYDEIMLKLQHYLMMINHGNKI